MVKQRAGFRIQYDRNEIRVRLNLPRDKTVRVLHDDDNVLCMLPLLDNAIAKISH